MRSAAVFGSLTCLALAGCTLDRNPSEVDLRHAVVPAAGAGGTRVDAGTGIDNPGDPNAEGGIGSGTLDGSAADSGSLPPLGFTDLGTCDPTGVYAVRLTVDVVWGGRTNGLAYLTDNGRGRAVVDVKLVVDDVAPDGTFVGELQACNAELPPFYSTILCEVYQPLFPTLLWDQPTMPQFPISGGLTCSATGCDMRFDKVIAPIGVDLTPTDRKWPPASETLALTCAAGTGKQCFPDQDNDKQHGITVAMRTGVTSPPNAQCPMGYPLRSPPLSDNVSAIYNGVQRADQLYLGVRVSFTGAATIGNDCVHGAGKGVAGGFDSRAPGCRVQTGTLDWPNPPAPPGTYCTDAQRNFIDQNLPDYRVLKEGDLPDPVLDVPEKTPSPGTLVSVVRVGRKGEAVGCGAVRAALF